MVPERGSRASLLQGSGELVPAPGWHRARYGRRKSGRVEPDINNVQHRFTGDVPWEGVSTWSFEARSGERASNGNERQSRSCGFCVFFGKEEEKKARKWKVPLKRNLYTLRNFYKRN